MDPRNKICLLSGLSNLAYFWWYLFRKPPTAGGYVGGKALNYDEVKITIAIQN